MTSKKLQKVLKNVRPKDRIIINAEIRKIKYKRLRKYKR